MRQVFYTMLTEEGQVPMNTMLTIYAYTSLEHIPHTTLGSKSVSIDRSKQNIHCEVQHIAEERARR